MRKVLILCLFSLVFLVQSSCSNNHPIADTEILETNPTGNEISVHTILSRYLHPNPPSSFSCTLTGLEAGSEYTINVAPMSLTGTYSSPIFAHITTPISK